MGIISDLKTKKVVKKIKFSAKIDEDVKSSLIKLCDEHEIKFDDFVNEVLKQAIAKESKKVVREKNDG